MLIPFTIISQPECPWSSWTEELLQQQQQRKDLRIDDINIKQYSIPWANIGDTVEC